ncbi:phospholipase-like protein [Tanacetum coccineum]
MTMHEVVHEMVVGECHKPNSEGSGSAWKAYMNARVAGLFLLVLLEYPNGKGVVRATSRGLDMALHWSGVGVDPLMSPRQDKTSEPLLYAGWMAGPYRFMMLRLIPNPSPNQPFIFDIDGRTLEYGREDFCLITGFWFGKVNLDPKEKDHSKFRKRVFPKIGNLKGEHLLALVNKDVKFNNFDDEDVVRVYLLLALDFVFIGQELRHVIINPIVNLVDDFYKWDAFPWGEYMWSFFHKRHYNVVADRRKYHLEKLASNPKYEANYMLYGFVFPFKVRHEVHVRTEVSRVVDKEEVHVRAVDKEDVSTRDVDGEDMQERAVLAKTVKAQEQMIVDLQRRLFSLEEITKQLKTGPSDGPSDVDHLDKSNNRSENVNVGGLDHQSMEGVSQCINVDEPYKDACVSELMDVDQPYLVKNVLDDVHIDSVVKDADKSDVKTVEVPLPRQKFPRSYLFPNCTKKTVSVPEGVMALFRDKNRMKMSWTFPWVEDGHVIRMDFWEKLVGRSHTKRGTPMMTGQWQAHISVICFSGLSILFITLMVSNMVSPGLQIMLKRCTFPSTKRILTGYLESCTLFLVLTIYDSLGGPLGGKETHQFWLQLREKLQFQFPFYLDNDEVFDKKNIDKLSYSISFQYADGVPLQGGLYGDCGL